MGQRRVEVMKAFREALLDVWSEACRHIQLQQSVGGMARLLAEYLPLEWLTVRRFHAAGRELETVAAGSARGVVRGDPAVLATIADWRQVKLWAKSSVVSHSAANPRERVAAQLIPQECQGEILFAPLNSGGKPLGVLMIEAPPGQSFQPQHLTMFELLLEPLAIAVENDFRMHELAALRKAAEADRRSLLSRLGREDINEPIVGADTGLRLVMERVELVAQSDVPALILGETGTGKEVVSRAIHNRSKRAAGPFIRVNCGAIPSELIDSQLFGHEKGSFTGAVTTHQGWFERADGGTLFLDEIGELPVAAQVRLLRVLQDHQVERVGGRKPIHVDVRIVAATHRDLARMVESRTFREDLWYRINVFPILLPRLRERIEDIPDLVRHFAHRAAHRFGLSVADPSPADLQLLTSYPWPGNIRELAAVMDRAAILGNGRSLEVAAALGLSQPLPLSPPGATSPAASGRGPVVHSETLQAAPSPRDPIISLDEAVKHHIHRALSAVGGKIEGKRGAAELLQVNPHTLRARMRKLGIDWAKYRCPEPSLEEDPS